jgi:hypothetical protein
VQKCPYCGREADASAASCAECGTAFVESEVRYAPASRRLFTALLATYGVAFHLIFAVAPLLTASPRDWGPAVALLYLDFPLFLSFRATKFCDPLLNTSESVWLYSILGTAMYGGFGALIGYGIDRLRNRKLAGT